MSDLSLFPLTAPALRKYAAGLAMALLLAACQVPPAQEAAVGEPPPPAAKASPPWQRLPTPADLPTDRPLRAGFLVVDGVYNSELMAPYDVFQHTIYHTRPGIQVFTVSPDGEPITTFEGLAVTPHYSFADAPAIDVLVVPSAEHSMDRDLEDEALIAWVRETGAGARFVLSLCDGAFVLAQAGLLEGRQVTTFPGDQDAFAERFPHLDLQREPSFVHDGPAITSQGGAKSYDPALYLVDHLYGEEVTRGVGRGLIIPWPPTAGQVLGRVVPPDSRNKRSI